MEGLDWAIWIIGALVGGLGAIWGMALSQAKHIKRQHEEALIKVEKSRDEYKAKLFAFYDNVTPILKDVQMTLSRVVTLFEDGKRN